MTKHRKIYKPIGDGVELRCGSRVIASNDNRLTNFSYPGCPVCGMDIWTTGHSPDTDAVYELGVVNV